MAKHTMTDLIQMQSLPLQAKVNMTMNRIRAWYEHWDGDVYVSFSGGKDSTVLKHIVESLYDDVPSVFSDTGLEYPEIRRFAMEQPNVVVVKPEMTFKEVLINKGYPVVSKQIAHKVDLKQRGFSNVDKYFKGDYTDNFGNKSKYCIAKKWANLPEAPFRISHRCCDEMKKKPLNKYEKQTKRKPIIGTMASESKLREQVWLQNGCNAFDAHKPKSTPMAFWTEQDVLEYIKAYDVPYCKEIYGDIVEDIEGQAEGQTYFDDIVRPKLKTTKANRTGCIFCMFGAHLEKEPNRFQRLKQTHPNQYKYCIYGGEYVEGKWQPNNKGLGLGKVLDYIGVKYE